MKLGAARDQSRAAWRLVTIEVAADSATFSYRLDRNKLRQARSRRAEHQERHSGAGQQRFGEPARQHLDRDAWYLVIRPFFGARRRAYMTFIIKVGAFSCLWAILTIFRPLPAQAFFGISATASTSMDDTIDIQNSFVPGTAVFAVTLLSTSVHAAPQLEGC